MSLSLLNQMGAKLYKGLISLESDPFDVEAKLSVRW